MGRDALKELTPEEYERFVKRRTKFLVNIKKELDKKRQTRYNKQSENKE